MSKPAHEIRMGLIKAKIRQVRTRSGPRHTISVVRLFRNGDVWKESTRFGRDDLPIVRLVVDRAYAWILLNSHEDTAPVNQQRSHEASDSQTQSEATQGHRCD